MNYNEFIQQVQTFSQWKDCLKLMKPQELEKLEKEIKISLKDFNSVGFTRFVARELGLRSVLTYNEILTAYENYEEF